MNDFLFKISRIWRGQSVGRAFLDERLRRETLSGDVIDIGGGDDPSYIGFMARTESTKSSSLDVKTGARVDFETDRLPSADGTHDTVLLLNVLEHVFNYQHLSDEVFRITKPGGRLIGYTPFLVRYHEDPHDFFRYTHEALERILKTSGWRDITVEPNGGGPFMATCHQWLRSLPWLLRVPPFLFSYAIDRVFLALRPHARTQYPTGYFFICRK